jgi:hypothetical protein
VPSRFLSPTYLPMSFFVYLPHPARVPVHNAEHRLFSTTCIRPHEFSFHARLLFVIHAIISIKRLMFRVKPRPRTSFSKICTFFYFFIPVNFCAKI